MAWPLAHPTSATFALLCLGLAALWDRYGGEPGNRVHPVVWLGTLIGALSCAAGRREQGQLFLGVLIAALVPALAFAAGLALSAAPGPLQLLPHVFLLKSTFSLWTLLQAAARMTERLDANDLAGARGQLSWLCSRDASGLSPEGLAAATIESVAENLSDSLVAPLFYYACFGLPGALAYRAINTADAMIGYRGRYEYLGKAAARLDDVANYIPARLTAALLLFSFIAQPRGGLRRGLDCWLRDGQLTASPNAGVPMATMAGLLARCLDKPGHYRLGAEFPQAQPDDISSAITIARRAGLWTFSTCALAHWLTY